ncbi:alpha/beta fold hydrolase [Rhodococcus sp. NPDC059234]|uniref:alpha/beta fold hydrolase n=1 Tax=Rhodococcus sp. NPDC059234 TaxID=3346781 RepID=UPI00366EC290
MAISTVTSADGTPIAVDTVGAAGTAVILVGGAFNDRTTVAALATLLGTQFTAVTYDRRGRGDSGDDADEYAVDNEIDDLAAVIAHVGGKAGVFGHSSGGTLALEGVARGLPIDRVAVYETPYITDGSRPAPPADIFDRVKALVAAADRDGAAALFLTEQVGVPAPMVADMRAAPVWPFLAGQASSLPYDIALCGSGLRIPTERLASITVPALVLNGDATEPWMQMAATAVAAAIPGAVHEVIAGQDHSILQRPDLLAPVLADFFG